PVWRGLLLSEFATRSDVAGSEARLLGKIWKANDRACVKYVAQPYPGKVTDFRPIKQYRLYRKPDAKWDQLAQAGQKTVILPVYPAGMLVQPFVESLAQALRHSIDEALCAS
ncbi:MAG: hypothetical protein ACRD4Q_14925, partial [Candidatus Acidiferrales bacterium]